MAGRLVSHSRLSRTFRNEWCCTFTFPVVLSDSYKLNFTFTSIAHFNNIFNFEPFKGETVSV